MTHDTSPNHPTNKYAIDVVEGRIIAGPYVRAACKRHLDDLKNAPNRGFTFDGERALHVIEFFPICLTLDVEANGKIPFGLEPVYKFIIGSIFGWVDSENYRRFRTSYIEIGKGNAKSPVAAGIGLFGLVADGVPSAEIYSAAAKRDQAMILFKDAVSFVERSAELTDAIKTSGRRPNVWSLFHLASNSEFKPLASDEAQSGFRPHISLVDELHEHKSSAVVNMLSAGQKGLKQPLVFIITNSGSDKQTVCGEYHDKAIRVASQIEADDRFFSYVCALDEGDDPFKDESCWIKTNPMLGVTIQKEYIRNQIASATMPSKMSEVKRLNFCIWTQADNPFVDYHAWASSKGEYDLEIFDGRDDVCIGLDLSQVRDLTAAVFSARVDGKIAWVPKFWIPQGVIARKVKEDKVPYDIWIDKGWVIAVPGETIDLEFVANDLSDMLRANNIRPEKVKYDRWRIEDFKRACSGVNLDIEYAMEEHGQGFQDMAPAVDAFERSLMDGKFMHNGNPCMDWCAANAVVITNPAGGRKLDKGKNQRKRIDGIVAGVMSHHATSLTAETSALDIRWL